MTLLALSPNHPDHAVTVTRADGSLVRLEDPPAVLEALREMTDQPDVQVFAMTVHNQGENYHLIPRQHLPVFNVRTY